MTPSYRETMLDWAVAELMSPTWSAVESSVWAAPHWAGWRAHVRTHGPWSWTQNEEGLLIQAVEIMRKPIIDLYGPWPQSTLSRRNLTKTELATLTVMPEFFPPGGTLGQLARWIETRPDYAPEKNQAVAAMKTQLFEGRRPYGSLIAAESPNGGLVLIEGYKRAIAYLGSVPDMPVPAITVR